MKKLISIIPLIILCFSIMITGCGDAAKQEGEKVGPPLSVNEIQQMYTDPDSFKGRTITISGQVFGTIERDNSGVYFQMNQDPANYTNNTVVMYNDPEFVLAEDDYVKLTGYISGTFEGENALGGTVTAPQIVADTLEVVDYIEAVAPTIKEITVGQTQEQYGYQVTIDKVEFAESETRVYVTLNNGGASNFSMYSFNSKLIQGSTQYETQDNYNADYPEIQSDINPGIQSKGIICFPTVNSEEPLKIILEGTSDNYFYESLEPFQYNIE